MSNIDKQALRSREEFEEYYNETHAVKVTSQFKRFGYYVSPTMQKAWELWQKAQSSMLDELDKKQQYIKLRDQENEDIALTVGKLRVELEHYKSREERVTKLVLDNSTSWDVLYEKLEAAEKRIAEQREYYEGVIADGSKRIAELEAKLETADKLQDSAFRDGLKAGFSYGQTDDQSGFAQCMSAYSTRAGIGVKQQEDSVDSDVGRNQPGMVVAVHIDAGDFVKVKGQVFEVEETDFDDHDVTLWFVGGNALKCAASCPVEVVSAPVAAGIKVKGE
ncbi:ead/Ea22-like family protein [Salmonella enterica]|nr:ead/Ea22-like family protein [Salmonella enterica]ELW5673386.1 ead/Ea22-like family protein [Salmonella enterica]